MKYFLQSLYINHTDQDINSISFHFIYSIKPIIANNNRISERK